MESLFTTVIYQPFFNLLVGFYYLLKEIPGLEADMGMAVILFTIAIRILLLPVTIAGTRSQKERHDIQMAIFKIQQDTHLSPEESKKKIRMIFHSNRRILVSETVNFLIQLAIFFILYRIFSTGLEGADLHLLYSFMPAVTEPFNLIFLGKYDLSHTNLTLNVIQSLVIVAAEAVALIDSPFPINRSDIVRYLIILPIASFLLFIFFPAGKKLFIITTLLFSFGFTMINVLIRGFSQLFGTIEQTQTEVLHKKIT